MKSLVVRLSLSGSRSFPNMLIRQSELTKTLRICLLSAIFTSIAIIIYISPLSNSLIYMNISTLLLAIGMFCTIIVVVERGAAARISVTEAEIEQAKSVYPVPFMLPGLVIMFLGLRHILNV